MSFKESLCAIQREYAHLLRSHFLPESRAFDAVGQDVLRFQQEVLGRLISSPVVAVTDGKAIGGYARQVADFFADVKEFWASREQRLLQCLAECRRHGLVLGQIGDLQGNPDEYRRFALRMGLYYDAVVAVDPFSLSADRIALGGGPSPTSNTDADVIGTRLKFMSLRRVLPLIETQTDLPVLILAPTGSEGFRSPRFEILEKYAGDIALKFLAHTMQWTKPPEDPVEWVLRCRRWGFDNVVRRVSDSLTVRGKFGKTYPTLESTLRMQLSAGPLHRIPELASVSQEDLLIGGIHGALQGEFLSLVGAEVLAASRSCEFAISPADWAFNEFRLKHEPGVGMAPRGPNAPGSPLAAPLHSIRWMEASSVPHLVELRERATLETLRLEFRGVVESVQQRARMRDASAMDEYRDIFESELLDRISDYVGELESAKDQAITNIVFGAASRVLSVGFRLAVGLIPGLSPSEASLTRGAAGVGLRRQTIQECLFQCDSNGGSVRDIQARPIAVLHGLWLSTSDAGGGGA